MELIETLILNWFLLILLLYIIRHYWLKEKAKKRARVKRFKHDNLELVAYVENRRREKQ